MHRAIRTVVHCTTGRRSKLNLQPFSGWVLAFVANKLYAMKIPKDFFDDKKAHLKYMRHWNIFLLHFGKFYYLGSLTLLLVPPHKELCLLSFEQAIFLLWGYPEAIA